MMPERWATIIPRKSEESSVSHHQKASDHFPSKILLSGAPPDISVSNLNFSIKATAPIPSMCSIRRVHNTTWKAPGGPLHTHLFEVANLNSFQLLKRTLKARINQPDATITVLVGELITWNCMMFVITVTNISTWRARSGHGRINFGLVYACHRYNFS